MPEEKTITLSERQRMILNDVLDAADNYYASVLESPVDPETRQHIRQLQDNRDELQTVLQHQTGEDHPL